MGLADGSRIQLSRRKSTLESGNGDIMRYVSHTLNSSQNVIMSEEVNRNRMVTDRINVGAGATGGISCEYSYKNLTPELESAFFNEFDTLSITSSTVSAVASDNSINDTTIDLSGIKLGTWIKIDGFTTAANNGIARVESVTDDKVVLSYIDLIDEDAGDSITISASQLINGTTEQAYDYEELDDASSKFFKYGGMVVNTLAITAPTKERLTASIDFLGISFDTPASSIFDDYNDAVDTPIFTTSNNLKSLIIGENEYNIQNATISISNGLREQAVVNSKTLAGIGAGKMDITGSIAVYFAGGVSTLIDDVTDGVERNIDFIFEDNNGNYEIWSIPSVKFTNFDKPSSGSESDYIFTFNYGAKINAAANNQMSISRMDA